MFNLFRRIYKIFKFRSFLKNKDLSFDKFVIYIFIFFLIFVKRRLLRNRSKFRIIIMLILRIL